MSEENVEVIRKGFAAYSRGADEWREVAYEDFAPDVVMSFDEEGLHVHGRDELVRFYMELRKTYDRDDIEVERLVDEGDYVVVALHSHAVMKGTEDAFETRFGITCRFHDGKITETAYFPTFQEALEAAGLLE